MLARTELKLRVKERLASLRNDEPLPASNSLIEWLDEQLFKLFVLVLRIMLFPFSLRRW